MKIVCLKGGLGNQMFEYCRFRDLMESGHDEVYLFYDHRRLKQHNGLRLSDCFELELPSCPWGVKLVVWGLKICRAVGVLKRLYDDEKPEAVLIDDYSQHRRFIPNARRYFFFRQFLAELQSGFVQMIRAVDYPVSVHVRRGDYLHPSNSSFGLCGVDYFQQAIAYVRICGTYGTAARLRGFIFDDVVPRAYHFQFHVQLLGGIFGRRWQRYENLSSSVVPRPYMDQSAYLFGRVGRAIGYKIRPREFPFWISQGRVYYVERRR